MDNLKIRSGEWVVVCDGAKALILENVGDAMFPNLRMREVHEQPDPPTREQGTDAPGRSVNSVGSARSSVEQTDWHDEAERGFLDRLARRLDEALSAGETKELVVVAPPRALGMIRQAYSSNVRDKVRAEIDKDFVKMPVHEIERRLVS